MKKLFTFLTIVVTLALNGQAQVSELLTRYDEAQSMTRVAIANNLFENYLAQDLDTVYHYDNNVNLDHLDAMVYYWAGDYYVNKGIFDRAAICLNRALPLMRKKPSIEELPDCLSLLGIAYMRLGDLKSAIEFQEECLALDRKSGDPELISSSLNNIAGTCVTAGQIQHAIKYIEEALRIERTLDRPAALAIRLGIASEVYNKAGMFDQALNAAQKAYDIESTKGNPDKVGVRLSQLGAVYKAMEKHDKAGVVLRQAEEQLRQAGNLNSLSITLNLLGEININAGQYREAATSLRESIDLCATTGNVNAEITARKLLYMALRNVSPTEAITELEKYASLKDSIYSRESSQAVALFNVKYETAQRQHDMDILSQRIKNNHLWLGILGVVIVAMIVAIVLGEHTFKATRAKNKTLIKANLLKDELLELAKQQSATNDNNQDSEKIVQLAHEMGSMGEMPQVKITRREHEVMLLCCEGLLAKEVADRLNISQRTVETHKTNLYKKLGINNNVELIRYANAIGALQQKSEQET